MGSALKIKNGSKMQLAFDATIGEEPIFDMLCTFGGTLDESAFLISVPVRDGKPLAFDENQKFLIKYGQGESCKILAGFPDDVVRQGIHRYWKIRRVSEQRQFFQRADERVKAAVRVCYSQATWEPNDNGEIDKEDGITLDISAGGAAVYMNRRFDVGETCELSLPRIGTSSQGNAIDDAVSTVCWVREAPKGSLYRFICGLQFRFSDNKEKEQMSGYVANIKKKYKL